MRCAKCREYKTKSGCTDKICTHEEAALLRTSGHTKIVDQPPPVTNSSPPIWELVVRDMVERDQVGRARYGTPLQAFNGRDQLMDAYQEALDLAVYLRAAIEERRQVKGGG